MKKEWFKNHMLQIVVLSVMVLLMAAIWPLRLLNVDKDDKAVEKGMVVSGVITEDKKLVQAFVPQYDNLKSISVRFSNPDPEIRTGDLEFVLLGQDGTVLETKTVAISELKNNKYYEFSITSELTKGEIYVYQLSAKGYGDNPPAAFLVSVDGGALSHSALSYGGTVFANNAPVVSFQYKDVPTGQQALPYWIVLLVLALIIITASGKLTKLTAWLFFAGITTLLILAGDESRKPLSIPADDLRRLAGGAEYDYIRVDSESGEAGSFAKTSHYMLERGTYTLSAEYRSDQPGNCIRVWNNGQVMTTLPLDPEFTYREFTIELPKDSQEMIFSIDYGGQGACSIYSLELTPHGRFYQDTFFWVALFLAGNAIVWLLLRSRFYQKSGRKEKAAFIILLGVGLLSSLPYMNGSLNWCDDLCYHLLRIEGIKDGLLSGQLPVVIYPEGMKGIGYLNCMYPNFFLYLPAMIRILGVSMAASYKVLILLCNFATAFLTYYSVKTICGQKEYTAKAAMLVTVLYTLCPYRFTNLYARGALGEILAMTFLPVLLAGLYHTIVGDRKKWSQLVIGMSGLIQSHILSTMLGGLFCVLFGIVFLRDIIKERRLTTIIKAAVVTLLVNMWFFVPFVYFYFKGGLTTEALDWAAFSEYSLNFSGLLGTVNTGDYRTLSLGIPVAVCAGAGILYAILERKKNQDDRFLLVTLLLGGLCTYLVIAQFPGWHLMNINGIDWVLRNIQFAWRFLGPASLFLSVAGGIWLCRMDLLRTYRMGILVLLMGFTVLSSVRYRENDFAYEQQDDYVMAYTNGHLSKIIGVPKGDNTIVYPYEWMPKGTNENTIVLQPEFSEKEGVHQISYERVGTKSQLVYTAPKDGIKVTLPVINYPGYQAYNEAGERLFITNDAENNCIQIELKGDGQKHEIIVEYKGKFIFTAAAVLSIFSVAGWYVLIRKEKRKSING